MYSGMAASATDRVALGWIKHNRPPLVPTLLPEPTPRLACLMSCAARLSLSKVTALVYQIEVGPTARQKLMPKSKGWNTAPTLIWLAQILLERAILAVTAAAEITPR